MCFTDLSPRSGNGPQVVNKIGLGHANTAVNDRQGVVGLVGDDMDKELRLGIQDLDSTRTF